VVREPLGSSQNLPEGSQKNVGNGGFLCSQFDKAVCNLVSFATVYVSGKKLRQFTVL
jgi:hypothetical protein